MSLAALVRVPARAAWWVARAVSAIGGEPDVPVPAWRTRRSTIQVCGAGSAGNGRRTEVAGQTE